MTVTLPTLIMLVGAVHGLVLTVLLVSSRRNPRAGNLLLAVMVACYTLPLLKVTLQDLGFFRAYDLWPWSIELLYGLGPSLYLYSKTVTYTDYRLRPRELLHFAPALLEVVYYLSPLFRAHRFYSFGPAESTAHGVWMGQQAGAVASVLIYLALTHRRLWKYSQSAKGKGSADVVDRGRLRWLQIPVGLYSIFFVLWFSVRVVDVLRFGDALAAVVYQPLLGFLSVSTYWIGTRGYLEQRSVVADPEHGVDTVPVETVPVETVPAAEIEREVPTPEDEEALAAVFREVQHLMDRDELFLEGDLSLGELASRMGINPRLLSKAINSQAGMNFYDFVNGYRIHTFQERVARHGASRTILDLAFDCGFGSKTTFNHVFKKHTGLTPSVYRKQRLREQAADPHPADRP